MLRNVRFNSGRPLDNPGDRAAWRAGRLAIRPSGTEPVIRVMGEADDEALVDCLVSYVCAVVAMASNENAVAQY